MTTDYKYFEVERDDQNRLYFCTQKTRNSTFPNVRMEKSDVVLAVTKNGIYIYGNLGVNAFMPVSREWVEIMREAVATFDSYQGEQKPLDRWLSDKKIELVKKHPEAANLAEEIVMRVVDGAKTILISLGGVRAEHVFLLLHFQRFSFSEMVNYGDEILVVVTPEKIEEESHR